MNADWIWGLIGGALIGSGGAVYLLGNGRIMGASGILGGLIDGSGRNTSGERIAFIAGVILVPLVIWLTVADAPDTHLTSNTVVIIAAGLLVGLGTRIANGCTSGHGVCGISRLSLRGLVATLIYILAGAVTLALFRHLWGLI
ncbi:YeeE/YedE thiosulfate transporter family protein [Phaeobacter sp. JH20_02]|uniref:YeeE/YedE family protein n=1 Tax=unclassified Phaeobacter TaxID=2621772 RepID=UPI003A8BEBB9